MKDFGEVFDKSFKAAADMSSHQYLGVYASGDDTAAIMVAAKLPLGVLQNKPGAAGRAARVRLSGMSKILAGGTLTAGQSITCTISGFFIKCTSGAIPCGLCTVGASSGYVGEAMIVPNYMFSETSAATGQG